MSKISYTSGWESLALYIEHRNNQFNCDAIGSMSASNYCTY